MVPGGFVLSSNLCLFLPILLQLASWLLFNGPVFPISANNSTPGLLRGYFFCLAADYNSEAESTRYNVLGVLCAPLCGPCPPWWVLQPRDVVTLVLHWPPAQRALCCALPLPLARWAVQKMRLSAYVNSPTTIPAMMMIATNFPIKLSIYFSSFILFTRPIACMNLFGSLLKFVSPAM